MDYIENMILRYPELLPLRAACNDAVNSLAQTYAKGGKVMTCGNGGSAADAEHIVGELMKGFLLRRPLGRAQRERLARSGCSKDLVERLQQGIPAISLVSGVALPTACANDICSDIVFAQQIFNLGKAGDTLVAISTSGNSANVLAAMHVAKSMDIQIIGLTGNTKNAMCSLADILIDVPAIVTPHIQEWHIIVYHTLCAALEARLFTV
ncbi:SIS domain-containing protein [uncultured Desulfovibrio sp.]|uniref:D-sedoheptulose-7-phosphate isomerase n=1 Tax=uncultured Desulfovibrio sp. TaxID=167968 RepID=UPI00262B3CF9|nr:SIS domain-containing protein [uncultured Desulfovibrio sp.]